MYLLQTGSSVLSNTVILLLQIALICGFIIASLKMGERVLNAWLCFLAVAMNLLVMKQITLFGMPVTATDAIAVSYMLGLNLMQEYYGTRAARMHAFMAVFVCAGFTLLTVLHNLYIPNHFDTTDSAYRLILCSMPRICMASAFTFLLVQFLDIAIFQSIRNRFGPRWLGARVLLSGTVAECIDTLVFSYLALYGIVGSLSHVIVTSIAFKFVVVILAAPFASLCKAMVKNKKEEPFSRLHYEMSI